jgi:ABC-type amino acid transport system permease subunit
LLRPLERLMPALGDPSDREFFRNIALLAALMFVGSAVAHLATVHWGLPFPRDSTTLIVGRDRLNLWMYGVLAADSAAGARVQRIFRARP